MSPKIIQGPSNNYTVLDDTEVLLSEASAEEVENLFIAEFRARFWQMANVCKVDQLGLDLATGKILCRDCQQPVTNYNHNWKLENQRCNKCKDIG